MARIGRIFKYLVVVLVIAGGGAAIWQYQQNKPAQQQQQRGGRGMRDEGPVPVVAAVTRRMDVPVYFDGVGTVRALNTVTVRPQAEGKLIAVDFKEGQEVKRGAVLARIDPTTYQAQLDQAIAKKGQDEATLAGARLDLERYSKLVASNSVARQQLDTQTALVNQLQAQVRLDQAAIDNARAVLGYTTIVAPIDGRTGIRLVDEGNIVRAADTTGIVVITQLQPISILFTLPQQQLGAVNSAMAKGSLPVEAFGADNKTVIEKGTLQVVDNQVDQTTGTIKLKAEFANAQHQLWPGQFINVRLLVNTLPDAIVAPTAAVQRGPNGTFVYTVRDDNTVAVTPVTVQQQDESQAVLASGVEAGQRVVTTGFARLADGGRVAVTNADDLPPAGSVPVVQPRRPRQPGATGAGNGERRRRSEVGPSAQR